MKQTLHTLFEFMSHRENFGTSVLFMMAYGALMIIVGMCLGWFVFFLSNRKVSDPITFDDLISFTNRQSKIKKAR